MSVSRFVPPLDYLHTASRSSLQSFELARLNHAANLRREISVLMDQWIEETSEAMLARWMLENHSRLHQPSPRAPELLGVQEDSAADPFPNHPALRAPARPAPPRPAEPRQPLTGTLGRKPHK
jgi:hypothetical protein